MSQNVSAPTGATLDNLARLCNRFFAKNPLQHTINDLAFWICRKLNPYYFNVDARTMKVGAAVVPILKGLLKLYKLNPIGSFVYANQFDWDLCIKTNLREIRRLVGRSMTDEQWRYARNALKSSGILKIRKVYTCRGSSFLLRIDFVQLEKILEQLPQLKKQKPSLYNWPFDSGSLASGVYPAYNTQEMSIAPSDVPSPGVVAQSVPEEKTLSVGEETSLKDESDFVNREFDGALDQEGEMLLDLLKQIFLVQINNGHIRQIAALRRRKHHLGQMTFSRVAQYHEHTKGEWLLPAWMGTVTLDFLLQPGPWTAIVKAMEDLVHAAASEDVDLLEEIKTYEIELKFELQTLRDSPDAFWREIEATERQYNHRPWLMLLLYGTAKNWAEEVMAPVIIKAKAMMAKKAIWFTCTEPLVGWSTLLRMTAEEKAAIEKQADIQLRAAKWRVHQAQSAGAI